MRGSFVSDDNTARPFCLALRFAPHEHRNTMFQHVNLVVLPRHLIGELLSELLQMGHAFLQDEHIVHGRNLPQARPAAKPRNTA